jgi:translation initiation factor IF-3
LRGKRRFRGPLPPPESNRARINDKIRIPLIRLIDQFGNQAGIVNTDEARQLARTAELDLVEVAPNAKPPVCRIMDFGKFLFEQQKKDRAARRKQATADLKEVRLRPGTGQGDLDIKAKAVREFITEGHKVGIQLQFRGREQAHPELGIEMIQRFAKMLVDVAAIEQHPRREGRRMHAVLAPIRR